MRDGISGFILAGGASSRMGTEKAQLRIAGQTFLERIAARLAAATDSVAMVSSRSVMGQNIPTIPDIHSHWGALGGVHAALAACQTPWALIVACDLPFITRALLNRLAGFREEFEAVAPLQSDGQPQPLCALYRVDPCLERADHLIKSGERRPIALLQSVHARWVSFNELSDLVGADQFFDNINTPEDYARVTEKGVSAEDVGD